MQIIVRGKNLAVTRPLHDYAIKKLGRLSKFYKNIQEVLVELEVLHQKDISRSQVAHVTMWLKGNIMRCEETAGDLYSAIDLALDKLEKQLKKFKDKIIGKNHGKKISQRDVPVDSLRPVSDLPEIAEIKRVNPKPMALDEALLEARMLKTDFLVFKNSDTSQFNVLYRLKGDRFGLMEPA